MKKKKELVFQRTLFVLLVVLEFQNIFSKNKENDVKNPGDCSTCNNPNYTENDVCQISLANTINTVENTVQTG